MKKVPTYASFFKKGLRHPEQPRKTKPSEKKQKENENILRSLN